MDMTFTTVYSHPPLSTQLIVFFSIVWPFIAAGWMARRGKSAAPIAAMLVPVLLGATDAWFGLTRAMQGMALSGGGRHAMAAGLAEALSAVVMGAGFAIAVLILAAVRRHRPFVDRMTASLFAILIASVTATYVAAWRVMQPIASIGILEALVRVSMTGAVATGAIAVLAIVWTFLTGRGRVSSAPLPYGVPITAAVFVALIAITWHLVHGYRDFAMGRG